MFQHAERKEKNLYLGNTENKSIDFLTLGCILLSKIMIYGVYIMDAKQVFGQFINWGEIKKSFIQHLRQEKGTNCPCCGQYSKEYKRRLNSSIAACLVVLSKMDHDAFHHVSEVLRAREMNTIGRDFALLKHWGLVEEKINMDTGKRSSGMWKITESGVQFALGELKVPRQVFLYNGQVTGRSFEETTVFEALGDRFNFSEL